MFRIASSCIRNDICLKRYTIVKNESILSSTGGKGKSLNWQTASEILSSAFVFPSFLCFFLSSESETVINLFIILQRGLINKM